MVMMLLYLMAMKVYCRGCGISHDLMTKEVQNDISIGNLVVSHFCPCRIK